MENEVKSHTKMQEIQCKMHARKSDATIMENSRKTEAKRVPEIEKLLLKRGPKTKAEKGCAKGHLSAGTPARPPPQTLPQSRCARSTDLQLLPSAASGIYIHIYIYIYIYIYLRRGDRKLNKLSDLTDGDATMS